MCYGTGRVFPPWRLARGIAHWCGWVSAFPRPRAGSVGAAWWECEGLGEGNSRLGWWGHIHHPPAELPEEIPPGERIQTLAVLSLGWELMPSFQPAVLWMGCDFSNTVDTVILRFKKKKFKRLVIRHSSPELQS